MRDPIRIIYWITVVLLALLSVYAAIHGMIYVIDAAIFITLATVLFAFRKKLVFSTSGFLLSCAGMLMNTSGALGAYNLSVHGVGWDKLLHVVTSVGIGLLVYAYLKRASDIAQRASKLTFGPLALALLVFFIVVGIGAFNEISEFIGTRYFGFSEGILGMSNGSIISSNDLNRFDTHWDMIANAMGALFVVAYTTIRSSFAKPVKRKPAAR